MSGRTSRSWRPSWLTPSVAALGVFAVVALVLPFALDSYYVGMITGWIPLALGAAALNLLTGYNGQVSVGHGALMGLGAYAAGLLVGNSGLPLMAALVAAAVICFVVGVAIGLPALRIRGLYLALVTLAVATLFPELVKSQESWTGGSNGFVIDTPQTYRGQVRERAMKVQAPEWSGLADDQWKYLFFLAIAVVVFILIANLVSSRFGRAMVAVRDNEIAAETYGINVARVKVLTFGLSAAIAGVGGALFAFDAGQLSPTSFALPLSLTLMVSVVVGGAATIAGPVVGAISIGIFADIIQAEYLPEKYKAATPLVLGTLLIVLMLTSPGGTVGSINSWLAKRRHRHAAIDT